MHNINIHNEILINIKKLNESFIKHIYEHKELFKIPFIEIYLKDGEYKQFHGRFKKLALSHYITVVDKKKYIISAFAFYFLIIPEAHGSTINELRSIMWSQDKLSEYLTNGNNYINTRGFGKTFEHDIPVFVQYGGGEEIEDSYTINYTI